MSAFQERFERNERHHHAAQTFALDRSQTYAQEIGYKPSGIWYSVNGDWARWCSDEEFRIAHLAIRHKLTLDPGRILALHCAVDVEEFAENYRTAWPDLPASSTLRSIDWPRVASKYAGIEIAPYQWRLRLAEGFTWYYGWDCASGCVWDLSAVLAFEPEVAA